jgi:hypothetical protein
MNLILLGILIFIVAYLFIKYALPNFLKLNNSYYIGEEVFPTDTKFEVLRQSSTRSFFNHLLGSRKPFKSGDINFDNEFFISSDYKSVSRAIQNSTQLQHLIALILSYKQVHSIVVRDDRLRIKIKMKHANDKKNNLIYIADVLSTLRELKKALITELDANSKVYFSEDKESAKEHGDFIKKITNLYLSLVIAVGFQYVYTGISLKESVMLIDSFSLLRILVWGLIIFVPVIFYMWLKLFGSVRIHLLYWKSLFLFFPTCLLLSYHLLYSSNFYFDNSDPEKFVVEHTVKVGGGKNRSYYYNIRGYPFDDSYIIGIRITGRYFSLLREPKKSEMTVKEGWLGVKYITNIKPL